MILVADSGSTKADWVIVESTGIGEKVSTVGFNPYFHDESFIFNVLQKSKALSEIAENIEKIFFFGAGCSSNDRIQIVSKALGKFFIDAQIVVDHDVKAAVLATCGDEAGISCILGTGSNSCYFDGKNIHKNNYGLGFIMGDEGSGSYFGKKLIAHYLYNILPKNLKAKFEEESVMSKEIMIAHVYNNPNANVWLASFAKFFTENKNDPWIIQQVTKGIEEFFDLSVCGYDNFKKIKIHFVGSIAFYFQEIVRKVGNEKNAQVDKIIQHPIGNLAEYYWRKEYNI